MNMFKKLPYTHWIIVIVISYKIMSDSDRRSTRRKRGPRRGSTNRALCSGLTGPVTRGI